MYLIVHQIYEIITKKKTPPRVRGGEIYMSKKKLIKKYENKQ